MIKTKKFDCVEMKQRIQEKLLAEYSGMEEARAHKLQLKRVKKNPLLRKFPAKAKKHNA